VDGDEILSYNKLEYIAGVNVNEDLPEGLRKRKAVKKLEEKSMREGPESISQI
jgi:hypothetical protein